MIKLIGCEEFKINLMAKQETDGKTSYRWQREDGEWVSPTFTTEQAAIYMPGKIPFLSDAEWKEFNS